MSTLKDSVYKIIRRPLFTEKSAGVGSLGNCVVFDVHKQANKIEIKQAVEKIFDVKVKKVRTANFQGKLKRVRTKVGRQPNWKKAYVSLAEGSRIEVIEGL